MKIAIADAEFRRNERVSDAPCIFYIHGYLWIGNDGKSKACFGTVSSKINLVKLAKAILKDHNKLKTKKRIPGVKEGEK